MVFTLALGLCLGFLFNLKLGLNHISSLTLKHLPLRAEEGD